MSYGEEHSHYDLESKTERVQEDLWDTQRELREAIRELTLEVARLTMRVQDLEQRIPDPLWAEKAEAANRAEWE